MKKSSQAIALCAFMFAALSASAQKRSIPQKDFELQSSTAQPFKPYEKKDFAPVATPDETMITLPNKKKVKLSDYVRALNQIERNLSAIGITQARQQKTVLASRYKLAGAAAVTGVVPQAVNMQVAQAKPRNQLLTTRFLNRSLTFQRVLKVRNDLFAAESAARINALPNEKFERNHNLTPDVFKSGDYGVKIVANYYLKGENDPFVITSADMNAAGLERLMKGTTSFYTAGLKLTASSTLPSLGGLTGYELDAEFTARANSAQKHSARAKLTVMQQVLLNETPTINNDNYTFSQNRSFPINKLIGSADVFTYGLNLFLPVDFYFNAVGVGADIDVDLKRTGISGSMGPRASQSIILETSATELVGAGGELIGATVDAGVGGELRLIEGGLDYGFRAGLLVSGRRLVFENDMFAEVDMRFLRGRLYTFYTYPYFKCENIITQGFDLKCWEQRRVENDLFNTGAA
ncbi:MAG: hypothetical protein EOO15_03660, partial [Chitinophagaceae bacterium]